MEGIGACRPAILSFMLICLICACATAENWPAWRGPDGSGASADTDLPLHWSATQNLRWRVPLPDRGNSTPVAWGDRLFITQAIEADHRRTVMCFARSDGKLLWQSGVTAAESEPTNGQNPYCSASPVTDGRRVIAYFGSPGLYCYDYTGKELWHRDVGKVDSWQGSGSSPVIYQRLCILNAGPGTQAAVVACDLDDGHIVWKVTPPPVIAGAIPGGRPPSKENGHDFDGAMMAADPTGAGGFRGSWSTPVILHAADHDEVVVVHPKNVTAYDPATGNEIWTCGGLPEQAFATPALGEGCLVATGHRLAGGGTRVTAIKLGGHGDVTATHRLWQIDLPKECVSSGLITSGRLYLLTQFGSVISLDLATGQKKWEHRLSGQGSQAGSWSSLVMANGTLLAPNHSGEVFVLKASPEFELLATNWAGEETTCASLAVSDGMVYLRTYKAICCFGKDESGSSRGGP